MYVIGTAGHVDHGKTLLIEALTGINADRLPEEKRRGLTIDLGFAHFLSPEGEQIGVIDVPGHERFIRNMVAGAWALDLALLTVAADDGWMQQSTDHTRVLQLMGVPGLIAVITKADLASPERITQLQADVAEHCSLLGYGGAAILPVSARSGRGIDELRDLILGHLVKVSQNGAAAGSGGRSPVRLYVDRVFTVKGSGVVVTGSLKSGMLKSGQELLLLPQNRRVRIRGLESYYKECREVHPTSRVAVNLGGVEPSGVGRGDLLTDTEAPIQVVEEFICRLTVEAPKRDLEVEVAYGTGHQLAGLSRMRQSNLARIRLSRPAPLEWNQPLVLIRHGGSAILGGGRVLWLAGVDRRQRRELIRLDAELPARLSLEHWAVLKLALDGAIPPSAAADRRLSAQPQRDTEELSGWLVSRTLLQDLSQRICELAATPGGVRIDELAGKLQSHPRELPPLAANRLVEGGKLANRAGVLFPAGADAPQVSPMGRQLLRDLKTGGSRGLELSKLKMAGARKELRNLVRTDLAVTLDGEIYYEKQCYLDLVAGCLAGLEVGGTLTIARAKERTGLSRKYVIPLLNRMERDGLVRRSGDERIVTARP